MRISISSELPADWAGNPRAILTNNFKILSVISIFRGSSKFSQLRLNSDYELRV